MVKLSKYSMSFKLSFICSGIDVCKNRQYNEQIHGLEEFD